MDSVVSIYIFLVFQPPGSMVGYVYKVESGEVFCTRCELDKGQSSIELT